MLVKIISVVLVALIFVFAVRLMPKIFLYVIVAAGMAIKFVAKKIFDAVPWTISAVIAVTIVFCALGRQFFVNEDAKIFVARKLSPQNLPHEKTFALLTIGLILELHEKFS
ncbi:MAG: hypothetical protein IJ685_07975 [Selenomonadaceae bacterium]|nr:hypothetical protein [Selenomonadaceae bacterium]